MFQTSCWRLDFNNYHITDILVPSHKLWWVCGDIARSPTSCVFVLEWTGEVSHLSCSTTCVRATWVSKRHQLFCRKASERTRTIFLLLSMQDTTFSTIVTPTWQNISQIWTENNFHLEVSLMDTDPQPRLLLLHLRKQQRFHPNPVRGAVRHKDVKVVLLL